MERDLFANINEEDKIQSWLLVAITVFWNDLEVETSWIVGLIKAGSGDGYNCTVNKKNKGNTMEGWSELYKPPASFSLWTKFVRLDSFPCRRHLLPTY